MLKRIVVVGALLAAVSAAQAKGSVAVELESDGLFASVLGSYPIGEVFSVYGRAGMLKWKSELTAVGAVSLTAKEKGTDPLFGVGVAAMVDTALLRLEYRSAEIDGADTTAIGVNVVWRFW